MIYIDTLRVHEFRGIRDLTLDLGRKNFAICGPNGTGKSGFVDALEFVLSGRISRLMGKGSGDISIKSHGPHIDCAAPEDAYAEASLWIPSLKKNLTIRRTLKAPKSAIITPDTLETRKIVSYLEDHPEFALSRREICNYVLAEPGKRSADVQALLKLEQVNDLRLRLQRIARNASKEEKSCRQVCISADETLTRALDITKNTASDVLNAVNTRRKVLELEPLLEIGPGCLIAAQQTGMLTDTKKRTDKAVAFNDVEALKAARAGRFDSKFIDHKARALEKLTILQADTSLLNAAMLDDFLRTALNLYDGEQCPACSTPYTEDDFYRVIDQKRAKLAEVATLRVQTETEIALLISALETERELLRVVWAHAKALCSDDELAVITAVGVSMQTAIVQLKKFPSS